MESTELVIRDNTQIIAWQIVPNLWVARRLFTAGTCCWKQEKKQETVRLFPILKLIPWCRLWWRRNVLNSKWNLKWKNCPQYHLWVVYYLPKSDWQMEEILVLSQPSEYEFVTFTSIYIVDIFISIVWFVHGRIPCAHVFQFIKKKIWES